MFQSEASQVRSQFAEVQPLYERGYVIIPYIGNFTHEKFCVKFVWVFHWCMDTGSTSKIEPGFSDNDITICITNWIRYSALLRAGRPRDRSLSPGSVKNFLRSVQTGSGTYPASYPMGTGGPLPGGKAAGAWKWPLTSN
jgi:hypothetical protein